MRTVQWERMLVSTDFSSHSGAAVDYAHQLAEKMGAELHVLHVATSLQELVQYGVGGASEAESAESYQNAWLASLLGARGNVRRIEAVRVGQDVAAAIVKYAGENQIDLMVIATHGRTGLTHLLMGSVAEKLIRTMPCPVLVIRP